MPYDLHAGRKISRARPRGHDGRFVPKAAIEQCVEDHERKMCGWCHTMDTSQWRVGPTDGSLEMGTLCNACGINYRRALSKSGSGKVDLDLLARDMGPSRPSIQKAIKRQRKLAVPPSSPKRNRTAPRASRHSTSSSGRSSVSSGSPISMLLCENGNSPGSPSKSCHGDHYSSSHYSSTSSVGYGNLVESQHSGETRLPPFRSLICSIQSSGSLDRRQHRMG